MTEEKFREIYHQYYQLVIKVVYNVLHDKGFSEDICQEVFLAFLEKADSLEEQYYKQWLLVNAKRKAIDFAENHIRYMKQLQQYLHKMKTDSGHRAFCGLPTERIPVSLRKMR